MRRLCAFVAMIGALFSALPVSASEEMPSDVTIVFIKADENDDGFLSKTEVLKIAILQFSLTDLSGDDRIDKKEVGDLAGDSEFSDNDTDKNEMLSLEEMIAEKLADFTAADLNKDGKLSLDEFSKF